MTCKQCNRKCPHDRSGLCIVCEGAEVVVSVQPVALSRDQILDAKYTPTTTWRDHLIRPRRGE